MECVETESGDQAQRLREYINDLIAMMALPSVWSGRSGEQILTILGDTLLQMLDLHFVFTRINPTPGEAHRDVVSIDDRNGAGLRSADLSAMLAPWLSCDSRKPEKLLYLPTATLSVVSVELGVQNTLGTLLAGAVRDVFPRDTDMLLLHVASYLACSALQEEARLTAQHRAALELEKQVASAAELTEANRQLRTLKDELAAELDSLAQLHRFSTSMIEAGNLPAVLEQMLASTIQVQGADFGVVQLYDPEQGGLVIVAQRNFRASFLSHFALVRANDSACGRAVLYRRRVIIEDVEIDAGFVGYRHFAAEAGFRAVQSTPLISHSGELLGMLSTHFRRPHRPSDNELRLTDIYVRQAARMLERERADEESSKLASIVQNSSDFIGIATLSGQVLFVNEAGRRMIGLQDDHPVPPHVHSYVADEHRERLISQILPMVEREGFWEGEISFQNHRTGRAVPLLQHLFFIRDPHSGRRVALATVCRDITERKRTEATLSKVQQDLARASRVLSIGELTASIAHEINQPLAAIVANGNACRRWINRDVPHLDEARTSLDNIIRDGNRASDILVRIRAFAAKAPPFRSRLDVNEVIGEVVAIAAHELTRERVALRMQLSPGLPTVVADRIELQQVVLNLVINGIEALRGTFDRSRELTISTSLQDMSTIAVAVRDNGSGIAPADLDRMFEVFFTTKSHGMGLGLAVCRRIIEAHGGKLAALQNPQCGLTLVFTLPGSAAT